MKIVFRRAVLGAALLMAGSTACSADGAGREAGEDGARNGVGVTSCGRELAIAEPPERAIALEQNATEIMLALGLEDRMIGTSYQTDPVLGTLADAYARVPVLADQYPSRETVLAEEPDFLFSTLSSAFAPDAAGERADWAGLDVPAYLSGHDCEDPALTWEEDTHEALFAEITEIAEVFGVPERGADLVDSLSRRLDTALATAPDATGLDLMWYYSGTSTPHIAGAGGLPSTTSRSLGARNAFDDVDQKWFAGAWEDIAERNPDVIVLADLTRGGDGDSAAAKEDFLRSHPAASRLDAVRADRIITVPGSAMDPSVRSVGAVEALSEGLADLDG
ncbi:ABC transporter substrate-binding protein [Streptomyces marincola]|uniref:Fe/B12 periplasmic-binding domain-containing protein n=1 Tax=Streptomyces marincola TaxID=2878388 RepID=A0A1W7D4G0_9ACTN|nr:ABC transporter substrate-binding protein [Streptomyces marincola]ARQ71884.1 hypothetical protein CAG99_26365 [Streptomyces marincola]